MKGILQKSLILFVTLLIVSCASREKIVYYSGSDSQSNSNFSFEPKIQPDDLLYIFVNADDPEAALPFNVQYDQNGTTGGGSEVNQVKQQYLVDSEGFIQFPTIGSLKVSGLSRTEVVNMLKEKIKVYINEPIINFRIINYKVIVQGEVNAPGVYKVQTERITLPEALSMAGDLTIKGVRENIMIIRESQGVRTINRVDITKSEFINSPFYYLNQNDVVYVEPNKVQVNSSAYGPSTTLAITIASFLITTSLIIFR